MYTIALIQNQSEMFHYGYADARPLMKDLDLGYKTELYTADNIDTLGFALSRGQYDAIVLASNALNDKTIRAEFEKEAFIQDFGNWLKANNGRGCLCLHQLRLAGEGDAGLKFLPDPLNKINAKKRPKEEESNMGEIEFGFGGKEHILSLYPNKISPSELKQSALKNTSLPGFYWHFWEVDLTDWEVLIVDPSISDEQRALIVSSRASGQGRIVVSALTLDWQKQNSILQNILTYVVEGKHNTALLSNEANRTTAFDYLIETLRSRKYPFGRYSLLEEDLSLLQRHISNHIHNILVLGPFVDMPKLPEPLTEEINKNVQNGSLKLISVEGMGSGSSRFSVSGKESSALKLLHTAEFQIQTELGTGYIDGSFWSTVETLQILQSLDSSHANYKNLVDYVLSLAKHHDRNGSYDEVFGVSCAFLWMRGTYLGVGCEDTQKSIKWVRERVADHEPREKIQAYITLNELKSATPKETKSITTILKGASASTENLSEIDIVVYLKASLISENRTILPKLVTPLKTKQRENGSWVDLATTATTVTTLIDVLVTVRTDSALDPQLKQSIEDMVFKGIIHIQNSLQDSSSTAHIQSYPWAGKASTTAKCIQAWLKFEDLIDFPVYELVEVLAKYDSQISSLSFTRQALSVLETLTQVNSKRTKELSLVRKKLSKSNSKASKSARYFFLVIILGLILVLVTYILIILVVGSWSGVATLGKNFIAGLAATWLSFLGIVTVVTAIVGIVDKRHLIMLLKKAFYQRGKT